MDDVTDPAPELAIDVERGAPTVIRVRGDIDLGTSPRLGSAVDELLETQPGVTLVFELGAVGFMDSSGLAVLVRADNAGSTVHVANPSPAVRLVLETTGLAHLLEPA